jgi:hypothetical protein
VESRCDVLVMEQCCCGEKPLIERVPRFAQSSSPLLAQVLPSPWLPLIHLHAHAHQFRLAITLTDFSPESVPHGSYVVFNSPHMTEAVYCGETLRLCMWGHLHNTSNTAMAIFGMYVRQHAACRWQIRSSRHSSKTAHLTQHQTNTSLPTCRSPWPL